jgi:hypothetical protein
MLLLTALNHTPPIRPTAAFGVRGVLWIGVLWVLCVRESRRVFGCRYGGRAAVIGSGRPIYEAKSPGLPGFRDGSV